MMAEIQEQWRSALTESAFVDGDVSVVTGQFNQLGSLTVSAGQYVRLGYGSNPSQEGAEGRVFLDLRDNAAAPGVEVNGKIRFSVHSPQDRYLETIAEFRTETLRTDISNRQLQIPFPATSNPYVSEDRKIVLEFMPDTATTVSQSNTVMIMDTIDAVV